MLRKIPVCLCVLPLLVATQAMASQAGQQAGPQSSQQASPHSLIHAIDPSDARIVYTGRWDFSDPSQPWCGWQGSSIRVRFIGTKICAELNAGSQTEYFRIIVDGDHAVAHPSQGGGEVGHEEGLADPTLASSYGDQARTAADGSGARRPRPGKARGSPELRAHDPPVC